MPEAQKKNETDTEEADVREENPATEENQGAEIETLEQTPAETATAPEQAGESKGKGGGAIGFIALIVALGAFGAGYVSLQKIDGQQAALQQDIEAAGARIDVLESGSDSIRSLAEKVQTSNLDMQAQLDKSEKQITAVDSKISDISGKIDAVDSKTDKNLATLQQSDADLHQSLNKLQESLKTNRDDDFLVVEARHLVSIASQQAQLNHNPTAAAAALEAANQRLSDAGDPALLKVRKSITDDIIALRNVTTPDMDAIALTLSKMEGSVDGLTLKFAEGEKATKEETPPAEADVSSVGGFFSKIWHDIKGLVTIRRNSAEQQTALLPPGQRFFLEQNLRLKLEAARVALLQRDTQAFRTSVATASQWLERYFDTSATDTANMITTLSSYKALELQPQLPDISTTLQALEKWQSEHSAASKEVSES
jgi:uroporphyrin-3 C-methyltransferase